MILTLVLDAASRLVVATIVLCIAIWSGLSGRFDSTPSNPFVGVLFTFVISFLFEDVLFKTEFLMNTVRTQTAEIEMEM
jgi:multisubunit Na+/H+ antiporter MnhE subunit